MCMLTGNFWFLIISFLFVVFFYDFIDINTGFTYIDELFIIYLFIKWLKTGSSFKELNVFFFFALVFLINGLIQKSNVYNAVIMDFFIEIKPFLAFYFAYTSGFVLNRLENKKIRSFCMTIALLILLPIGLDYVMGGVLLYDFFGHPSRFSTICQLLGFIYLYCSNYTKKYLLKGALIIAISLLSGRSKSFGFIPIYLFLIYYPHLLTYRHLFKIKNIIAVISLFLVVIYVAREKILFYFVTGSQAEEMFARPVLFVTSWRILQDHPILGSGLGSFATNASAIYYSSIYEKYEISHIYGLTPEDPSFISDTYFPILAQFGFLGILLFLLFWKRRILRAIYVKKEGHPFVLFFTILVVALFVIEGFGDSTLIQNRGVYIMMLLGFVQGNFRKDEMYIHKHYCPTKFAKAKAGGHLPGGD